MDGMCFVIFLNFVSLTVTRDSNMCGAGRCCTGYILRHNGCTECEAGTTGPNCREVCPDGYYGRLCKQECPTDCKGICNKINGDCPAVMVTTEHITHRVLTTEHITHRALMERTQEKVEWMNNLKHIPGLLASQSIQSVVIVLILVVIIYIFYKIRRLHGALSLSCEQSKHVYTPATQGQGQLTFYTGLHYQTANQEGSVDVEADYILPMVTGLSEQTSSSV